MWRWRKTGVAAEPVQASGKLLRLYLVLWSLTPTVFFTFAGNILWTYVLPALAPLALLGATWLTRQPNQQRVNRLLTWGLMLSALLFACFVGSLNLKQTEDLHTTKRLVAHYAALNTSHSPLIFYPVRPYSAAFYSRGQARQISQPSNLLARLTQPPAFLAVKTSAVATLPPQVQTQLQWLARHGGYTLFLMGSGVSPVAGPTD